jgi:hypothetical protein
MGARNAEPITDISIWHRGVRMIRPRILKKPLVYAGMSALRGGGDIPNRSGRVRFAE